uniref:Carboxylesterase type B domain-containing protein n=1 Tax=Mycena chlorophos TaxID=658473 RepID=A0ABQ0L749_MYCCL|nr:predicted protein [Mycena chlorophos]
MISRRAPNAGDALQVNSWTTDGKVSARKGRKKRSCLQRQRLKKRPNAQRLHAVASLGASYVPIVTLDQGVFTGKAASQNTQSFLGIPFAQSPVGPLRFQVPQPLPAYTGKHNVTSFGLACPQQAIKLPTLFGLPQEVIDYIANTATEVLWPSGEDCLTLNVIRPNTATASSRLPVVAWIFGGGFEIGSPATYDGTSIVERSIAMGQPVIYVSMNYRLSVFGFLASKEVRAAGVGNLGLQDQRQALRWIQKYIGAFGGDPARVTIWGESAGAISVASHMVANGGNNEGLFRAAFMQSGSPIGTGPLENGQKYYDAIVKQADCSGAADTLSCLRTVPYNVLKAAQDASPFLFSYQSLVLPWMPREDGIFLTDHLQRLVQQGKVANVPFVTGNCDDEGTLFSFSTLNITTDAQFINWVKTFWMPVATTAQEIKFASLYPSSLVDGSPFDTGILNALTPQFKRLAAFQGDAVFQAPRRFLQQSRSGKQNQWAFLSKRLKATPFLGALHASDLVNVYGDGELRDYLINFVNNLDPNGRTVPYWPAYTNAAPNLLTFLDGLLRTSITQDTYRMDAMVFLTNLTLEFPPMASDSIPRTPVCHGMQEQASAEAERLKLFGPGVTQEQRDALIASEPLALHLSLGLAYTIGSALGSRPPSADACLAAFVTTNSVGLSAGARAWSKHAHRSGTGNSSLSAQAAAASKNEGIPGTTSNKVKNENESGPGWWGAQPSGSVAKINQNALVLFHKVMDNATWRNLHWLPHQVLVYEVRVVEGYGLRWSQDRSVARNSEDEMSEWLFRGFVEPMMEGGHDAEDEEPRLTPPNGPRRRQNLNSSSSSRGLYCEEHYEPQVGRAIRSKSTICLWTLVPIFDERYVAKERDI